MLLLCRHGYVNNCSDPLGGWALGCRIDGGQAEYVRVPYADQGLTHIPDGVSDAQALFTGDLLATGFWAARIAEIVPEEDTVLIIGAGPTGICTLLCVMLRRPRRIIVCEKSPERRRFVREHYPEVVVTDPEHCLCTVQEYSAHGGADAVLEVAGTEETLTDPEHCLCTVLEYSEHGGADTVLEVAGTEETFRMAWECARPNAVVTVVAMYDRPQVLPLPDMYGKNLTFKTGGVDGCDCAETAVSTPHRSSPTASPSAASRRPTASSPRTPTESSRSPSSRSAAALPQKPLSPVLPGVPVRKPVFLFPVDWKVPGKVRFFHHLLEFVMIGLSSEAPLASIPDFG